MSNTQERIRWHVRWRLEKRREDIDQYRAFSDGSEDDFHRRFAPYEVIEGEGNMLMNAGIQLMLDLLIGAGGTVFNNANSYLAVGDSSTAAVASQTDLQAATNKLRKAMSATYPQRTSQTLTFRGVFGDTDANFAWNEWAIANASSGGTILNRKVVSLGTKAGGTWTFTVTVTIS